jgi:hypothetical protein
MGLATLPVDRFVAIRSDGAADGGLIETPLFETPGMTLLVNAETEHGDLLVEVLGTNGNLLPGFEKDACVLTREDALRHRVAWMVDGKPMSLPPRVARTGFALRFILRGGSLYAFQIV